MQPWAQIIGLRVNKSLHTCRGTLATSWERAEETWVEVKSAGTRALG